MIVYENLTFRYPGANADALHAVSLAARAGELTLVCGPSGSGKSTLLRAANGLVPHFSGGSFDGRVVTGGHDTRATKPRDLARVVGFVAQDPDASSVASTVEDEVVFVLENLGIEPSLQRKRVEETLDALGIAPLRARRLDTLSGGERQRVAIAAVLVAAPQFLVLDEPTSMLDPQSAEEVVQTALRCAHELGIGVVMSEHRLERVLSFADTLVVVENGRVQAGDPRALAAISPVAPPVVRLGRALGWQRAPLSVRDAREALSGLSVRDAREALSATGGEQDTTPHRSAAETPGNARLRVRGLRVALGGREVIRSLDLSVAAGETLAIVGRNGAGKTTLMRAIVGLTRRAGGEVHLDGERRDRVNDAARVAAFVPQHAARMLAMPRAIDEVATTLRARKLDPGRAHAVLEEWGLSHVAHRDPHDLSAGEATRLALAASCAHDPGIILLDEPTRGMDEPSKRWLAGVLAARRRRGAAVVLVTHDVELVAEAATRVALMADGEIVVDGPVRDVLGESVMFSSQMNKVFGDRRVATVDDALAALGRASA